MLLADWAPWQAIGLVAVTVVVCAALLVWLVFMLESGDPRWWR